MMAGGEIKLGTPLKDVCVAIYSGDEAKKGQCASAVKELEENVELLCKKVYFPDMNGKGGCVFRTSNYSEKSEDPNLPAWLEGVSEKFRVPSLSIAASSTKEAVDQIIAKINGGATASQVPAAVPAAPAGAPPAPPAPAPATPEAPASAPPLSSNPTTRIEEILTKGGKKELVPQFTAINDECGSAGENESKCREILKTAWTQLAQQTMNNADQISTYVTDRPKQGVQYLIPKPSGSGFDGFTSISAVLDYAKKGGAAGETGGAAAANRVETSSGIMLGGSFSFGVGYWPFFYGFAEPDSTNGTSGDLYPGTRPRISLDDESSEGLLVESLRQALTGTGGERTRYATLFPGARLAVELLGPASSGWRFAGRLFYQWDRFIGYSTERTLSTAEHGNLHEHGPGLSVGTEVGGGWGSVHLLVGGQLVWGVLSGTAQAGPYAGLGEHERAFGLRGGVELGYCTPGNHSFCAGVNAGYTGYPDDFNKNTSKKRDGIAIIGPRPEGHPVVGLFLGYRGMGQIR